MSQTIEVKVPDIGDFKDVAVIEVFVKAGEQVAAEQSLITLETDKAAMEVPCPAAGTVKALSVKVGDKVSEGSVILTLESSAAQKQAPVNPSEPSRASQDARSRTASDETYQEGRRGTSEHATPQTGGAAGSQGFTKGDIHAEVVVLGAGPGGYTAAFRAADLGKQVVLVEKFASLGGVCLNVGCIPSKALLHVARVISEAEEVAHHGVTFAKPKIDIDKIRSWKESVVNKLTGGLAALAKQRKVRWCRARRNSPRPTT